MPSQQSSDCSAHVYAENVGGIDETSVQLPPGVTVLTGRNATNRTSFLQAIMAGLGSTRPSLKGDADEGHVELQIGETTYTRTLSRTPSGSVSFDGDPYLEDTELADLFAFLLEQNESRRAVARGDDLRELIMRPIDTDEINQQIREAEAEKRRLDQEIDRLEQLEAELPSLESDRRELREELETVREEADDLREAINDHEIDPEESRDRKAELEEAFDRVRDARSELDSIEFEISAERETLEQLRTERDELEAELDEFEDEETDPERLSGRIEELRRSKRAIESTITELQSVISFNEEMLEGEQSVFLEETDGGVELTDQLVESDSRTTCWTCGSEVEESRIENTLDRLQSLRQQKLTERNELRAEIRELSQRGSELRERKQERSQAEQRLEEVESEIDRLETRLEELEAQKQKAETRVEELEAETESFTETTHEEVLSLHQQLNERELRIESVESELEEVESAIAEREAAIDEREQIETERAEVSERLKQLRTRVGQIERNAVQAFNEHMASVLEVLEYENVSRVWIERRDREDSAEESSRFDLQVIRETDDGTAYRDRIEHLSESEREVTGLVFALAGYLVHDVHEEVPFMILDSMEAIDTERIAAIVEYFEEYTDHLVVALLPEDAEALPETYNYVTEI